MPMYQRDAPRSNGNAVQRLRLESWNFPTRLVKWYVRTKRCDSMMMRKVVVIQLDDNFPEQVTIRCSLREFTRGYRVLKSSSAAGFRIS